MKIELSYSHIIECYLYANKWRKIFTRKFNIQNYSGWLNYEKKYLHKSPTLHLSQSQYVINVGQSREEVG